MQAKASDASALNRLHGAALHFPPLPLLCRLPRWPTRIVGIFHSVQASNVFTRGEIHNMLLPALLSPTSDEVEAARRAALMQASRFAPCKAAGWLRGLGPGWRRSIGVANDLRACVCASRAPPCLLPLCLPLCPTLPNRDRCQAGVPRVTAQASASHSALVHPPPAFAVQHLYQELGRRGDSQIRPHLKPGVAGGWTGWSEGRNPSSLCCSRGSLEALF